MPKIPCIGKKLPEKEVVPPKYIKPKIMLIDIKDDSAEKLKAEGYNITTGSFGNPYRVEQSDSMKPVITNASLPNHTEQEIVVVDLVPAPTLVRPKGEKRVSKGEHDLWASCSFGFIDPRIRTMVEEQEVFDRVLSNGGVFVVFSDRRFQYVMKNGFIDRNYGQLAGEDYTFSSWDFLSVLSNDHITVSSDDGTEIKLNNKTCLDPILSKYIDQAHFSCTISDNFKLNSDQWIEVAHNKYGDCVSAIIGFGQEKPFGWVIILPQIEKKAELLSDLFQNRLPQLSPHLFPDFEGKLWLHSQPYELPSVEQLYNKIDKINRDAEQKVSETEAQIEIKRNENQYLYDLLTETGDPLVQAVIKAFGELGFANINDVDKEMKENGTDTSLREDIQIHDMSPTLIVDVKGISGLPTDDDARQANKHTMLRMREWDRRDVTGLTIINHQRNLPPLERENSLPYRQEMLDFAEDVLLGLMTTWDLYRIIRNVHKNEWSLEQVRPLFYKSSRIFPIPDHYEYIGTIARVWPEAGVVGVVLESGPIKSGDKISFEFPIEYEERQIESIKVNEQDAVEVNEGDEAGLKIDMEGVKLKEGLRVYRVKE